MPTRWQFQKSPRCSRFVLMQEDNRSHVDWAAWIWRLFLPPGWRWWYRWDSLVSPELLSAPPPPHKLVVVGNRARGKWSPSYLVASVSKADMPVSCCYCTAQRSPTGTGLELTFRFDRISQATAVSPVFPPYGHDKEIDFNRLIRNK